MMQPLPKEVLIDDCKSLTIAKIAEKYSVSRATINRWLKFHSIKASELLSTSDKLRRVWSTPEFREKMEIVNNSPELLLKRSKRTKEQWQDEVYRDRMSEVSKKMWQDPDFRASASENNKIRGRCPELRKKIAVTSRKVWKDEALLRRHSDIAKEVWQRPEYKEKFAAVRSTIEFKNSMSAISKARWQTLNYRAKQALALASTPRTLTRPHLKVCELLTSLGINYITEEVIGPWTFDIFIESANVLIEVQGDYWHSLPKAERNDRAKSTYIAQHPKKYRLYYIWEHECLTEGSVLAKLKHWLGLDIIEQVDYELSKVMVKPVEDIKQADTFLYNWHYQHHGRHGLDLGGYLGDELICLARFTSPSRAEIATSLGYTQKQVLELARLVVHPKYQKKNLCSWFLARCERYIKQERPEIECLVSFADSTHNHTGIVYKASNWELNRVVEPNYWYVDQDGWIMHKKTLWNHASSLKISELEYAEKNGYVKVWGKEKYKFTRRLK